MIQIRRSDERGYADHGWLTSHHTFSFANYYDPAFMGFRALRVMNEDRVAAGRGFGTHSHDNMEIVSYVLEGELEHKDSMGNGETLRPGEFQRISAGTGITHSEFNPSADHETHFYQIWLLPEEQEIPPSYEQKSFLPAGRNNKLQLVASPDGSNGSLKIHQDAKIYLANVDSTGQISYNVPADRHVWLQVLRGDVAVHGESLRKGDALATTDEPSLQISTEGKAELMLFDLA